MRFHLEPIDLKLKNRFTTHIDSRIVQHSHIITIEEDGLQGTGEVTAHPFYNISRENILKDFESIKSKYDHSRFSDPESLWSDWSKELSGNKFLLSGLDVAAHDLSGKRKNNSLYKIWGGEQNNLPISSYTIGIDTPEIMLQKMKATPWSNYKIKLGTAEDIGILQLLRQATNVPFRIDANCAWDYETLISMNDELAEMNIEFIEQPIHPDKRNHIINSRGKSHWPLVADESFKTMEDLEFCADNFDTINIKLVKCGGLTPARHIIKAAKQLDLKIMIGCMTESSIAISAASQLLPWADYADLDGALLITNDVGHGTIVNKDETILSDSAGVGFVRH